MVEVQCSQWSKPENQRGQWSKRRKDQMVNYNKTFVEISVVKDDVDVIDLRRRLHIIPEILNTTKAIAIDFNRLPITSPLLFSITSTAVVLTTASER